MTQKPNFQAMSRKQLRAYVLKHRDNNDEALRVYMDRLQSEPGVVRFKGGGSPQDLKRLEEFIESWEG